MFKNGELVTAASLLTFFKKIKIRLNELSAAQIASLSVGQVIGVGHTVISSPPDSATDDKSIMTMLFSSSTEQYFDSYIHPVYYLPEDDAVIAHGGENFLEYFIDEIDRLEE